MSGSYLLYPWVNRLSSPYISYKGRSLLLYNYTSDDNELPIHGYFFNTERKITAINEDAHQSCVTVTQYHKHPFPSFFEIFRLKKSELEIETCFFNNTSGVQYFSYGYHPYLSLDGKIDSYSLDTNLFDIIPLNDKYLPKTYILKNQVKYLFESNKEISINHFDHCFTKDDSMTKSFVSITNKNKTEKIVIESKNEENFIPLNYFQIYTPKDRKSIAIEPLASTGDVFSNPISNPIVLYPGERKSGKFSILYESI